MHPDQITILAILAATVGLFLWGRWRHDVVAGASLLACVLAGVVGAGDAFAGFGHPAVITVACVLVLSRGLQTSGAIDALTRVVLPKQAGPMLAIASLTALAALLSAFMNNVGALALLMPVAIQIARKQSLAPGQVLMPLAFGSILGGMTTLIGTPPNLIVSGFRAESGAGAFAMFDFAPVGLAVAGAGVLLIVLGGWKLVPVRKEAAAQGFDTGLYLTEVRIRDGARIDGLRIHEVEALLDEHGAQVVGMVQSEFRVHAPHPERRVNAGDILVLEAEADTLSSLLSTLGVALEEAVDTKDEKTDADDDDGSERPGTVADADGDGSVAAVRSGPHDADADAGAAKAGPEAETETQTASRPSLDAPGGSDVHAGRHPEQGAGAGDDDGPDSDKKRDRDKDSDKDKIRGKDRDKDSDKDEQDDDARTPRSDIVLQELAVLPGSTLAGRTASDLSLRTRYSINLLALSREGQRSRQRLRSQAFRAGDLLLLQGTPESIAEFASHHGGVPLAERDLRIPDRRKALTAAAVMVLSIAAAALGLVPAAIAFALGVLASMVLRTVPPRDVYDAIDWPVIVLLAALIPVAGAMESTGTADLIARFLFTTVGQGHAVTGLVLILVVTMTLSDLMNNAATAAVMCPIAVGAAATLGVSADPFLMAVAVGASCAFLTPIGHQNNTLILGPGGFRFGDYWRLGVPVQLLVIAVAVPMLLMVWPLVPVG